MPLEATVVDEGAAYGAALLAGAAAGVWPDARTAVSECVKVTRTVEPRAEWVPAYAEARERFRGLYPALRPLQASA
jgi:xylulokinase